MARGHVIKIVAWTLALALVCGSGWWAYRAVKKNELQRSTLALVQDSTVLLREALGLVAAGAEIRTRLESSARDIVRMALETWGYDVEEAADAREAVALFEREAIDLVIVEVGMPDPNAVETIVGIREVSAAVPIIAVSDSPMALEDATALGVSLTLHKPFDSEKLWVAIRWLLGRRRP